MWFGRGRRPAEASLEVAAQIQDRLRTIVERVDSTPMPDRVSLPWMDRERAEVPSAAPVRSVGQAAYLSADDCRDRAPVVPSLSSDVPAYDDRAAPAVSTMPTATEHAG